MSIASTSRLDLTRNSLHQRHFEPEPDLHPLYPSPSLIAPLLSPNFGLSPAQKLTLVSHCLTRACVFADLSFLHYILHDPQAHQYVDLNMQDDDGLVLVSVTILGFGSESERDVEREECVRLLITEGADVSIADKAGWTPLHHAALLAPPTLIAYLLTHGCSSLTLTRRKLVALDILTAYSVIPGREDVALILEEAMRTEGWQSDRVFERRLILDRKMKHDGKQRSLREGIGKTLDLNTQWWGNEDQNASTSDMSDDEDEDVDENVYTPPVDYSSMLVFSPSTLPGIFETLITNFHPSIRNADPANILYMLARFACLTCDHTWLEDLIIGATDAIEETFFSRPDDLTSLIFWLYNTTVWLHLMRCDAAMNETCEILGSFFLLEEVINSVFVFLIRFAERRIDKLLDVAILDHSPLSSEFESVQFESDWSFFRSAFSGRKKGAQSQSVTPSTSASMRSTRPPSPALSSRPPSPSPLQVITTPTTPKAFSSLRHSFARARAPQSTTPLQNLFSENALSAHAPQGITSFLTALHTLLIDSGVNPALITQLWSQVFYWSSCEIFNRILTRRRYLCRSRAIQIGMNISLLEEWVGNMGLPRGVESHFLPVRELLHWLQCLSSMDEFSDLVATIQTMKHLNPLQMRRAVRDYRYEVNESRMSDDCSQYLVQLQKDWERQRVKLGVEALRKEIDERERERDDDGSSMMSDVPGRHEHDPSISSSSTDSSAAQKGIDLLFDRTHNRSEWMPVQPPEVLGELLDSRYMLPLLFPSDPRMLSAAPGKIPEREKGLRQSLQLDAPGGCRSASRSSLRSQGTMAWRSQSKKLRQVRVDMLQWIDGVHAVEKWGNQSQAQSESEDDGHAMEWRDPSLLDGNGDEAGSSPPHLTPLTRNPSTRNRAGRTSTEDETVSSNDH